MYLKLNGMESSIQLVYQLAEDLKGNPEYVNEIQSLTKDKSKMFGLKGTYGLFGSDIWWDNIQNGVLPTRQISGVITDLFAAGQDSNIQPNAFDLLLDNGSTCTESIYVNNLDNYGLFKLGSRIHIIYVLDELKIQPSPSGGINYTETVMEVAISQE